MRRGPWGRLSLLCPRSRLLTRAALFQLLHGYRLAWWWGVLHTAQQRLHEARPIGRADAYVVPWLVLEPFLACGVQAHQDRGPAESGERGQLRGVRRWNVEGARLGPGKEGLGRERGRLPYVDLLLCRFSTERTVAWNIFRLCTWIRPEGAGNESEPEPGSLPRLRVGPETLESPEVQ